MLKAPDAPASAPTLEAKPAAADADLANRGEPAASGEIAGTTTAHTVCAPMFGVVHLTPAPGEAPFVKLGDAVEEGQVLCTIEAMKMFNAI